MDDICYGNAHLFLYTDIDECVIGLEPCNGGQRCLNTPGSFRCQSRHRHHHDEEDGGRQSDVDVAVGGDVDLNGGGATRPHAERSSSSATTTTTTTTTPRARTTTTSRRHRPRGMHCGTGFHYNRRTGRCEGRRDEPILYSHNNYISTLVILTHGSLIS